MIVIMCCELLEIKLFYPLKHRLEVLITDLEGPESNYLIMP